MTVSRAQSADSAAPGRRHAAIRLAIMAVPTSAALAAAVFAAGPANAATVGASTGPIFTTGGMCLDDAGAGTANFNPIQVYGCNSTAAQTWTIDPSTNTVQTLGKCLDVQGGGTADGTLVDLYDCNGTGAQQWIPQSNGSFYNPQSNKCLDDTGYSASGGTQATISDCNGSYGELYTVPTVN